jgi:GGDEF domain-containing protein
MNYARFEQLVLGIAALAIVATVATTTQDPAQALNDIVAGLLLLIVLAAAVHFGRRGGSAAAIGASAAYVLMSIPAMAAESGLTSRTLVLLVMRVATFGLVGIAGGEACGRLRHFMTRYANAEDFDEWASVFNQRYAVASLERALSAFERYQQPFSLVLITIASDVTATMGPKKVRTLVRGVSSYLRGDLRMVDELARLDDGRFLALLPHTSADGGDVVRARLAAGVRELIGAKEESVTARTLSTGKDAAALWSLLSEIAQDASEGVYSESGAYSSAGESVLNPAEASAVSAPGPSTLNMSTAAAPEGSTKQ